MVSQCIDSKPPALSRRLAAAGPLVVAVVLWFMAFDCAAAETPSSAKRS
jgi:hypothetical protein